MMAHLGPLSANLKSKLFIGFLLSVGGSPVPVGPWLPLPSTAIFEAIAWVVPVGKEYEAGSNEGLSIQPPFREVQSWPLRKKVRS